MTTSLATIGVGTHFKRGDGGIGGGAKAAKTIGTSNQALTVTAKLGGTGGNSKTFGIVVAGNSTAFSIVVTANSVLINSATDSGGVATTTVDHAIAQLYQNATFQANFDASTAGNGTGVLVAGASAVLVGGTNVTELFTDIANVTDINGPNISRSMVDVTHMQSTGYYREFKPGLKDGGSVQLALHFVPGDTNGQAAMRTDFENGVLSNYQITFTDAAPTTYQFAGYVESFEIKVPIDSPTMANVTVKITGPIVAV